MSINPMVSFLQGEYTTVEVRFDLMSKLYTYKTRLSFTNGDFAVVNVNGVLKLVEVKVVHSVPKIDFKATFDYKWIVCKVDTEEYTYNLVEEAKLQEHLDTMDRLHKRQSMVEIFEKTYAPGTKAREYFNKVVKPLLKD